MNGSEGLGYGTQLLLDGAYADPAKLADQSHIRNVLQRIVTDVEPALKSKKPATLVVHDAGDEGVSAALIQGETAAVLHSFPQLRAVTFHLFSAHDPPLSASTRTLLAAFDVGRFQSAVRAFGQYPPRDPQLLERALVGARAYVRLRVTPAPTVTT